MSKPIDQQVIVITGASSGIGLATAQEAARRGAKVVIAARNGSDLERWAATIRREGGQAVAIPTDVANYVQVQRLVRDAISHFGRIDTFISAAAVSLYGTFDQVSLEDFRRVIDVNFMGQVHCAKAALPYLKQTRGTLISIGSALSDRGVPLQGAYCASKHALKGWLDSLRTELERKKASVQIVLVKPSSINTPLFHKAKTLMGVEPQPIPPVYEPEVAVREILQAAEKPQRDVYVGAAGKIFSIAERINPKVVDLHQRRFGFDAQKTEWPRGSDVSNLYIPLQHDGGVWGDFSALSGWRSVFKPSKPRPLYEKLALAFLGGVTVSMLRPRRVA
jgi:NAD(P)-dependent dehydrogenase (short-subunit alcohol dehydrogenase family)